jgi:hypothetical protein
MHQTMTTPDKGNSFPFDPDIWHYYGMMARIHIFVMQMPAKHAYDDS